MATAKDNLITAEEFQLLPDDDTPSELVRGRVQRSKVSTPRYGCLCADVGYIFGDFMDDYDSGRLCCRSGVITQRNPDTVRGADISYYSYERLPRGPIPDGYLNVAPELVFVVCMSGDPWETILQKTNEFLEVGVVYVCVLDEEAGVVTVYHTDEPPRLLTSADELTLPDLFGLEFRVPVSLLFAE